MLRVRPTRISLTDREIQASLERITLERTLISEIEKLEVSNPLDFEDDGLWCVPSQHPSSVETSGSDGGSCTDCLTRELAGENGSESTADGVTMVGRLSIPQIEGPDSTASRAMSAWILDDLQGNFRLLVLGETSPSIQPVSTSSDETCCLSEEAQLSHVSTITSLSSS